NLNLQIVEGQTEANIIYSTHIAESLELDKNYLYIDVGGGSTELSIFTKGKVEVSRSFSIGTVRMLDNADTQEEWDEMHKWIKANTRIYKNLIGIGTGGNINKLFRMSDQKDGSPLSFSKLNDMYLNLRSYSLKERISLMKLNPDRAD